ncbi:MAG: transketolase family protein [Eubacteriales bacterium]|jgi:transketolase
MAKAIRDVYGDSLLKYGKENDKVVVLDADVSCSTKSAVFGNECPDRFFNCGIAEYAMVGMAGGFAKAGKVPFVNTFAVFLSTIGALGARALMSYSKLNIKLMGAYGGLSDAYDGPTHHAIEDVAIMRALPGVTVMVASDAAMTDWMVKTAIDTEGPMYIRLSRDATPDTYTADTKFEIGKALTVKEGSDAAIIACGIMVSKAMEAAEKLAAEGIKVKVVDMFTIKPIDAEAVLEAAKTGAIVTAEEHNVYGGLGSAVAEVLVKNGAGVPVEMIGLQDTHAETGAYNALLAKYGMDADAIAAAVKKAIANK